MIKVYYDGKCGLCAKEINHYRRIAPSDIFDWQDITQNQEDLISSGISLVDGLKLLHAKDSRGQIHVGLDAFILIWGQLRRWRMLATLISLPIIRQVANSIYISFAKWRFKRLEHCQIAQKHDQ